MYIANVYTYIHAKLDFGSSYALAKEDNYDDKYERNI